MFKIDRSKPKTNTIIDKTLHETISPKTTYMSTAYLLAYLFTIIALATTWARYYHNSISLDLAIIFSVLCGISMAYHIYLYFSFGKKMDELIVKKHKDVSTMDKKMLKNIYFSKPYLIGIFFFVIEIGIMFYLTQVLI